MPNPAGKVFIGTCGWSVRGGRRAYFEKFDCIEIQSTFYKLPSETTAAKWAEEAPPGFRYTMKAFQAVTHPPTSPTWRKAGITVPEGKRDRYGFLKPTEENFEAWEQTVKIARAVGAKVVVVQCPASFRATDENAENLVEFFKTAGEPPFAVGLELRGNWRENEKLVAKLCDDLGLIHVVDPFRWYPPLSKHPTAYFRLHGIGRGEVNYRYKYTDEDLARLKEFVERALESREEIYVMFNNLFMAQDAERFKELISA